MAMIYVRTKPGRKAFYEGRVIPHDNFIPVTDDPYIRRLVHHWEDLEVQEGATKPAPAAAPAKAGRHTPPGNPQAVSPQPAPTAPPTPPPSAQAAPGTGAPPPKKD
jgi:hypothetical protein